MTKLGIQDAKICAKLLKLIDEKRKITAIISSNYNRCIKTAEIINSKIKVPIILDDRFNEFNPKKENWTNFQKRNQNALNNVLRDYGDNDIIVFVTSGVNVTNFINLTYQLSPSSNAPFLCVPSCSPIMFEVKK